MERWRAGEMESWRDGELKSWRAGELESWRDGERAPPSSSLLRFLGERSEQAAAERAACSELSWFKMIGVTQKKGIQK